MTRSEGLSSLLVRDHLGYRIEGRHSPRTSEMAHDLLELVVDGPEAESVWAMYQAWPEREGVVDDLQQDVRG